RLVNRMHPRLNAGFGLTCIAVGIVWYGLAHHSDTPWWQLVAPAHVLGLANAIMWAPISVTATRTLPPARAGAGSGGSPSPKELCMSLRLTHTTWDAHDPYTTAQFWKQLLSWDFEDPDLFKPGSDECYLTSPDGYTILFFKVPDTKKVKNRA
ncbi:VOC family protein, partial [Dermacoccus abyssi]